MTNVTLDEKTLYYQWLINNNSTSTMLNAISGNYTDNGYSTLGALGSIGSLGTLGSLGATGSILDFSSVLQNYLSGVTANSYQESIKAASMADKLSSVLEEASQSEDTSSLTYKTVQELYEYFSEQVSTKASALMQGITGRSTAAASSQNKSLESQSIEKMNQAALQGQEFDFSQIDDIVENSFGERMPLS